MTAMVATPPRLAVVVPLDDARGDELEHLRSWTERQTWPREQFQVVLGTDGSRPGLEARVVELLAPHDRVVRGARRLHERALCDAAARAAEAELLLFTELHCVAQPDCVERTIQAFDERVEMDGGYLSCEHRPNAPLGHLEKRMLEENEHVTLAPGHWFKLHTDGFVMRRQAYLAAGGLDGRYGLFADAVLAARAHELGMTLGAVGGARLTHLTSPGFAVHQGHVADWTRGECAYRADGDPRRCERYFGHALEWGNRYGLHRRAEREAAFAVVRVLLRALRAGVLSPRRREIGRWVVELAARLPAAVAGPRVRLGAAWAATRWSELTTRWPGGSDDARWRRYRRSATRLIRQTRLSVAIDHGLSGAPPAPTPPRWPIHAIPECQRVGFHGLEHRDGEPFRWSEPVALLRLRLPEGRVRLAIETRGLRGEPRRYVRGLFWNGRAARELGLTGDRITGVLDVRDEAPGWLVLVADALRPERHGVPDQRRLGVPVFGIEFERP